MKVTTPFLTNLALHLKPLTFGRLSLREIETTFSAELGAMVLVVTLNTDVLTSDELAEHCNLKRLSEIGSSMKMPIDRVRQEPMFKPPLPVTTLQDVNSHMAMNTIIETDIRLAFRVGLRSLPESLFQTSSDELLRDVEKHLVEVIDKNLNELASKIFDPDYRTKAQLEQMEATGFGAWS